MRRKGLVCLAIGLIVVPPAIYLSSQAWADTCETGEYVCDTGSTLEGGLLILPEDGYGVAVSGYGTSSSNAPISASQSSSSSSTNFAVYAMNSGTGDTYKYAVQGSANGNNGYKFGVQGYAGGTGINYGVYGGASGGTENWAGYFVGDVGVEGSLALESSDNVAISVQNTGTAAASKYAVYGVASGGNGTKHGLYGWASGTGTNYGIYAEASGGSTNYAGYFDGDVEATGDITAGSSSDFKYASARTFYYTVPAATCVDTNPNADEKVSKWSLASITAGTSPYYGYLNCPVRLPDGVTPTRVDCGVWDVDDDGQVSFWFYRMNMTGTVTTLAAGVSGVPFDEGYKTMGTDTLVGGDIDNYTYSYWIRVELNPSDISKIRFYQCRITYTMEDLQP